MGGSRSRSMMSAGGWHLDAVCLRAYWLCTYGAKIWAWVATPSAYYNVGTPASCAGRQGLAALQSVHCGDGTASGHQIRGQEDSSEVLIGLVLMAPCRWLSPGPGRWTSLGSRDPSRISKEVRGRREDQGTSSRERSCGNQLKKGLSTSTDELLAPPTMACWGSVVLETELPLQAWGHGGSCERGRQGSNRTGLSQ
ncbi:hypothetical protein VTI74DRAFT_5150 [Chaetomium olivicolor]